MSKLEKFKEHMASFFLGEESKDVKEVQEVKEDVVLEEDKKVEVEDKKAEPMYVTSEQLSEVKNELLTMFKALLEENKKVEKEVPQELSAQEEIKEVEEDVQLGSVEELVHSPEDIEVKKEGLSLSGSSPLERIRFALNN